MVKDPLDIELPHGKQRKKRGGMWYTPVSGIWQTVWLESVVNNYITSVKITPALNSAEIEITGGKENKSLIFEGNKIDFIGNKITVTPQNGKLWTPDSPHIYEFEIFSGGDRISSYFALRTIEVSGDKILLNGKPYFFTDC